MKTRKVFLFYDEYFTFCKFIERAPAYLYYDLSSLKYEIKALNLCYIFPFDGDFILGFRLAKHSTTQPPNSISIIYTKEQEESPSLLPWYKMDNQTGKSKSICLNWLGFQNNIMVMMRVGDKKNYCTGDLHNGHGSENTNGRQNFLQPYWIRWRSLWWNVHWYLLIFIS